MNYIYLIFALLAPSIPNQKSIVNDNFKIEIDLPNLRNNDGNIYIFLYNYENQYPYNPYKNFIFSKKQMNNNKGKCTITDLPEGNYVISLFDDENGNNDLDTFFGIPTEGFGFSNNVKAWTGFPNYNDLQFNLNGDKKIILNLQYIF
ncbi:DUF2141 domain-containing protein [Crocinitomix catalasitica]|uniref:DUF2141 domain-containing protein n=1 Tax=Crocinitomix catalasitica TaxID=184607 RepID=UPI000686E94C|nr:DUF2141 domain-containing protein [Crocinitomix catalasitica]